MTMLWNYAPACLILLPFAMCFPRGKVTEKPEVPPMTNPKHRKPTHISEFTDPDTGINPFVDLEEGRTSIGRNVMEDERRNDEPFFGIDLGVDLVEGDSSDRRWNLEEPKEHFGRAPDRWPELDVKDDNDFVIATTPFVPLNPPTTVEHFDDKNELEKLATENIAGEEEIQHKVKKEENDSFAISQSTIIYATATLAALTAIIVLVGACWWRKKLKTTRSSATLENGDTKS